MKKFFGIIILINSQLFGEPSIIGYLKSPAPIIKEAVHEELSEKINKFSNATPTKASRKLLKSSLLNGSYPSINGFLALYGGYSTHSGPNGQIAFPLRHTPATKLILIITPDIELMKIDSYTMAHMQIPKGLEGKIAVYLYEKKQQDVKKMWENKTEKQFYWSVSKIDFPVNGKVDASSVVILSKPKNIHIHEGNFLSSEDANLVLPHNLYVVGNKNNVKTLLSFMDLARYFEPVKFKIEKPTKILHQKAMDR